MESLLEHRGPGGPWRRSLASAVTGFSRVALGSLAALGSVGALVWHVPSGDGALQNEPLQVASAGFKELQTAAAVRRVPTLDVVPAVAKVGQVVVVSATGLPGGIDVELELCGDAGLGGSPDCSGAGSVVRATSQAGSFATPFTLSATPVPCPCAIVASSPSTSLSLRAPVTVLGAPVAPLTKPTPAPANLPLVVSSAELGGAASWWSYFGVPPVRVLTLTISNPAPVAVAAPALVVAVAPQGSRSEAGSERAVALGTLPAGSRRTYKVAIGFPALATGGYQVEGYLGGAPSRPLFILGASFFPWGLLVLALLAFQVLVVKIHGALRERIWLRRLRSTRAMQQSGAAEQHDATYLA